MVKIQKTSELAKLSIAALLIGNSIALAQEAPAAEPAPVAEPVVAPVEAPVIAQPVAEPAPAKPVEALSTTVAGTKISLYGRLELNAAYDSDVAGGLWSWSAPKAAKGDADGRTTLSAARTRIGFNLEGPSKEGEPTLKGKFEADFAANDGYGYFNGPSGAFRLRQSWGSLNFKDLGLTLLFGQTDDVVTPLDPPSINASSLNGSGNLGNRRPQIRLTEALGPVEVALAITHDRIYDHTAQESDTAGAPGRAVTASSNPTVMPAFQGRVGVKLPASWAGEKANLAVGVSGLYGSNETASDDTTKYAAPEPSYMFGADLSLPIIDILTLTGEFFTGQNLSRYGDGSLKLSRAYGKLVKDGKDLGGIQSTGWWTGLSAKLPANLSAGFGIGAESLADDSKDTKLPGTCPTVNGKRDDCLGGIESNMFTFANVAYNFTSAAKVTFEWLMFSTSYSKGEYDANDNLVMADNGKNGQPKYDGTYDRSLNRFEVNFRYDFK